MAHVHHEYLDENGDSVNVELDMVVESADQSDQEMRIVSVRSGRDEEEVEQITIENYDNDDNSNDYNTNDHEKENEHDLTGAADSSYRSSMVRKFSVLQRSGNWVPFNIHTLPEKKKKKL